MVEATDTGNGEGTVEAKLTPRGVVLTGQSFTKFAEDRDLARGGIHSREFPQGTRLHVQRDGDPATFDIDRLSLQMRGAAICVVGAKNGDMEVPLPSLQQPSTAEPNSVAPRTNDFTLPSPTLLQMDSHGVLVLGDVINGLLQTSGITQALLHQDPIHLSLPVGSSIQAGEQSRAITHCTLQRTTNGIVVLSASDGAKSVYKAKTSSPKPNASQAKDAQEPTKAKPSGTPAPLLQARPEIESELRRLLKTLEDHMRRMQDQATKASSVEGPRPTRKDLWPTALLAAIDRESQAFIHAQTQPNASRPLPQISSTAGKGFTGVLRRRLGFEMVEPTIQPEHPTFVASSLFEILHSGTVCGRQIPPQLRESVREFVEMLRERLLIGDGPYTVRPSKQVSRFATFSELRYEFAGAADGGEDAGFTSRHKTWKDIEAALKNGARGLVAETAFNQATERIVAESANARAPGPDASPAVQREYDERLMNVMGLARGSLRYEHLPPAEREALDERFARATENIRRRSHVPVQQDWMMNDALRQKKSGSAATGKGLK